MRANAPARPEQTLIIRPQASPAPARVTNPAPTESYDAGYRAAREWLAQQRQSATEYRDTLRCAFMRALAADDSSAAIASAQFNLGYAAALAQVIAGVRHG